LVVCAFEHCESLFRKQGRNPPVDLWTTQERALTTTPQAPHQKGLIYSYSSKVASNATCTLSVRFGIGNPGSIGG
jgi:hypothetical protein